MNKNNIRYISLICTEAAPRERICTKFVNLAYF